MPTRASSELERLFPGAVSTDTHERGMYARDLWPLQTVRLRRGDEFALPSAVVRPGSVDDVRRLLAFCSEHDVCVLPYGGGSGVCGGVLVDPDDLAGREAVALDLKSLRGVEAVDPTSLRATVRAGTLGMDYEDALRPHRLIGGHYPQSLYASTVGGWLACRSAGQASTGYGKGEDLVAGMDVVLASGDLVSLGPQPSTAAGPDLLGLFCGSEGTLGVIVRAHMRVFRQPDVVLPRAFRFASFGEGLEVVREMVQSGVRPSVVRLYDEADTALGFPGVDGCVLITVFEGALASASFSFGEDLGPALAERWLGHRYDGAYQLANVLKGELLGPHAIADTMEIAGSWTGIADLYTSVRDAMAPHCAAVLCHASHVYPDGACLYFTMAMQGTNEAEAEAHYHATWEAGMEATLAGGGTITHHHGIGRLKARWLRRELGEGGWTVLSSVKRALDPKGILNPGNLGLS